MPKSGNENSMDMMMDKRICIKTIVMKQSKLLKALLVVILLANISFVYAQETDLAQQRVAFSVPSSFTLQLPEINHLNGYLGNRYNGNLTNRLLKVDEKGLTAGYVNRPGVHRWIGEHIGKYLEAASNTWAVTGNKQLKEQMDRMAATLMNAQLPDGYLGTYLPEAYWSSWDVWSHKYNLYGLLAYHKVTGNTQALEVSKKIGDLLCLTFGEKKGQRDIIKSGTHVGMAATSVLDPMIDLYMWTGDAKYLDFCQHIIRSYQNENGPSIVETLLKEKRVDKVANAKAYEMLSNIVGIVKLYRITKDENLLRVSKYAFDDIVANRLYITGTTSDHERFKDDDVLQADTAAHMGEGCVTTTWIQLNMQLFSVSGDLKYFNEIEKSVYNQLLAAESPVTGCVSYYTPLMGVKPYACHITCCLSSVPRGIAFAPFLNYGKVNSNPTVLLYEAAKIKDSVRVQNNQFIPVEWQVESSFPQKGSASIAVKIPRATQFTLQLRVPSWSKSFTAKINGKSYKGKADEFVKINRKWKTGDKVTVSFEMPLTILDGGKSYPGYIAFKRGPQVLSLDNALPTRLPATSKITLPAKSSSFQLSDARTQLPGNWKGSQAYSVLYRNQKGATEKLLLVPFAEASQTGGEVNVWLPTAHSK
ncbi:MAG: hypothetical protein EOO53_20280 [Gammaproteobacteria bacterium]|nr:MAG: hypothetical protein EOO53_20280 [Gammaproteobacteria bacterium]